MYQKLTIKAIKELAAPQTWPASILPVLLAGACSFTLYRRFSWGIFFLLLGISILLQSAVNTFNDYYDFIRGNDTEDNFFDKNDASIIYNHLNPKTALLVGSVFLGLALFGGLYLVIHCGWPLFWLGLVGAIVICLYSAGPLPISYLPIGEFISGFMMGSLLPMAAIFALSNQFAWHDIYYCIPLILSIGTILLTNNTCDIERDIPAGRKTLPILLGKRISARLHVWSFTAVIFFIFFLAYWHFPHTIWLGILLLLHSIPYFIKLWNMQFTAQNRRNAMQNTLQMTILINSYYIIIVLLEGLLFG